jgi:hypothetical protein
MLSHLWNVAHGRNFVLSLTPTIFVPSRTRSRQHSNSEDQNERKKRRSVFCFVYSFFEKCSQVWEPVCELHDPASCNPCRHLPLLMISVLLTSRRISFHGLTTAWNLFWRDIVCSFSGVLYLMPSIEINPVEFLATGWMTVVRFPAGAGIFLCATTYRLGLGTTPPSCRTGGGRGRSLLG